MQNNNRYWFMGGIFGVFIILLILILTIFFGSELDFDGKTISSIPVLILIFVLWPKFIFTELFQIEPRVVHPLSSGFTDTNTIILAVIGWFILGTFFGWLYGKIKNRNKV